MDDQRLMDQIYASVEQNGGTRGELRCVMPRQRYDIIIIGTGAGGGTMAHALADSGARILVLERGDFVPREERTGTRKPCGSTCATACRSAGVDRSGHEFQPYTHYCVGGNTKFWGSVLYRLRREDFQATEHVDGLSPGWPIDYETLEPYYDRAERLYHVRGQHGLDPSEAPREPFPYQAVPHARIMAEIVEQLRGQGLHPSVLPLGLLRPGEAGGCVLCGTCNSFPCKVQAKSDAEVCCIREAVQQPTVTLWTNALARRLITDACGRRIAGCRSRAERRDGSRRRASRHRLVWRGQFGRIAAALAAREASQRAGEFIRAGGPQVHGASGHDDARLPSVPAERHGVSEDGRAE